MPARNPQQFFRFAAAYYPLLEEILGLDSVREADLVHLIERHRAEANPSANPPGLEHIRDQLLELHFLDRLPDDSGYEMPLIVADFLRYVRQEHSLTSVTQIQSYVEDINRLREHLDRSIREENTRDVLFNLGETERKTEQIREDVAGNKQAIVNAVTQHRANRQRRPLRERMEEVLRLWDRYLIPMRELIDTSRIMEHELDSLARVLLDGEQAFGMHPTACTQFRMSRHRLARMRASISSDFAEAMGELQPLHREYQRESRFARGASLMLARLNTEGIRGLGLAERLALPIFRREGQFNNVSLEAYIYEAAHVDPEAPVTIGLSAGGPERPWVSTAQIRQELENAGDVDDVMAWLRERLDGMPARHALCCFGDVLRNLPSEAHREARRYDLGDVAVTLHSRRLAGQAHKEGA